MASSRKNRILANKAKWKKQQQQQEEQQQEEQQQPISPSVLIPADATEADITASQSESASESSESEIDFRLLSPQQRKEMCQRLLSKKDMLNKQTKFVS